MSIQINVDKCTNCGMCRKACPGNLLTENNEHQTVMRCLEDCWGCTSCVKACKFEAISYFLGADIGGLGSTLQTKEEGDLLHWIIKHADETEKVITINKKQANTY